MVFDRNYVLYVNLFSDSKLNMLKELNFNPTNICGGGYEITSYKKSSRLEDNVVLLSMKGGVKLDSNKTRDRL